MMMIIAFGTERNTLLALNQRGRCAKKNGKKKTLINELVERKLKVETRPKTEKKKKKKKTEIFKNIFFKRKKRNVIKTYGSKNKIKECR